MATWSVLCKSLLKNAVEGGKAAAPHIMTFSKIWHFLTLKVVLKPLALPLKVE